MNVDRIRNHISVYLQFICPNFSNMDIYLKADYLTLSLDTFFILRFISISFRNYHSISFDNYGIYQTPSINGHIKSEKCTLVI